MSILSKIVRKLSKPQDQLIPKRVPVSIPVEAVNRRYGRIKNSQTWHDFGGPTGTMAACGISPSALEERSHVVMPENFCKRCKKALAES